MVESEIAALIAPWLTPTSLFVLLNIVLATIFLANNSSKKHDSNNISSTSNSDSYHYGYHQSLQHQDSYEGASLVPPPPQLVRAPSLFSRVASFNFSNIYYSEVQTPTSDVPNTVTRAPSLLYRVTSFNFRRPQQQTPEGEGEKSNDEVEEARDVNVENLQEEDHHQAVEEEKVEEKAVKVKKTKNKKVKKKVTEVNNEENTVVKKKEVISQVTAVKKVENEVVKATASSRRAEQEVDSKADDFINKFKQQLKMQRLESLLRYRNSTDN